MKTVLGRWRSVPFCHEYYRTGYRYNQADQTALLHIQLTAQLSLSRYHRVSMSVRLSSIICPGGPGKHTEKNPKAHTINLNFLFNLPRKNQAGERKVKYQVINIHLERTFIHLFSMDQGSH